MEVSLVTVVFNNVETIEQTIKSVLDQDYELIEYIIIDGRSSDGTLKILRKYSDQIDILVSEPDKGIYDAMNKGLEFVTGDIVGFLNGDDLLASDDCISSIVDAFKTLNTDIVYGDNLYVERNDIKKVRRTWEAGSYNKEKFRKGWMPPHLATYIKKECYDKYGNFDTSLKISADYELMFRFMYVKRAKAVHIPKFITKMRLGGVSNGSIKVVIKTSIEVYKSWIKHGESISPLIMLRKPFSKIGQYFKAWRS